MLVTTAGRDPGWYADPETPGDKRYWDGEAWTGRRRFGSFLQTSPAVVRPGPSRTRRVRVAEEPTPTPWWRRWWVIAAGIVAVIVVAILMFSGGGDNGIDPNDLPGGDTGFGTIIMGAMAVQALDGNQLG